MASTINADNGVVSGSSGVKTTADTSGVLALQSNGSTGLTLNTDLSVTFAGAQTYSAGTANGVTYLNGSKVLTSGSALTFDGTTLTSSVGTSAANTIFNSSANTPYIRFDQSNASKFYIGESSIVGGGGSGNYDLYATTGIGIRFFANAAEGMRLTSTGLGIGTTSPSSYSAKLAVVSTAADTRIAVIDDVANSRGGYLRSNYSDAVILGTTSGVRSIVLAPDNTERLRINTSGAFGINGANYGTSGQVLTSAGSGSAPSWADAPTPGVTSIGSVVRISGSQFYLATSANSLVNGGYTPASQLRMSGTSPPNLAYPR